VFDRRGRVKEGEKREKGKKAPAPPVSQRPTKEKKKGGHEQPLLYLFY